MSVCDSPVFVTATLTERTCRANLGILELDWLTSGLILSNAATGLGGIDGNAGF